MRQFRINLATRTYVNVPAVNAVFTVAGILVGVWMAFNILSAVQNIYEIRNMKAEELTSATTAKVGRQFTAKEMQEISERVKFVNGIYKAGPSGWLTLLSDLERVTPDGVAIKSIAKVKDELKIAGTARNFKLVREFMERTADSKLFRDVYLVSQGSAKYGKKQTGIGFAITCKAAN